jgi:hypothetical protein
MQEMRDVSLVRRGSGVAENTHNCAKLDLVVESLENCVARDSLERADFELNRCSIWREKEYVF